MSDRAAAPRVTADALRHRFGPRSGWVPGHGQIWRAVRDDVTLLVLLLEVGAESVRAAPVTVDGDEVDGAPDHLVLRDNGIGVPATVWSGLRRSLPMSVLDRPVDEVDASVVEWVEACSDEVPTPVGPATVDVRAELADDLALLATAETANAALQAHSDIPPATVPDFSSMEPAELELAATRLGVSLPVLLELVDGKRPPTPYERDILRETIGGVPAVSAPPEELIQELTQPRWRGLVRGHRDLERLSEDESRVAMGYAINAMAARQTGDATPSWPDRIRRWAQASQIDPDAER